MKNKVDIIKTSQLFAEIADKDIMPMLNCLSAKEGTYQKESYILSAGSTATAVGIVLSGSVNVIKEDFWGNRAIFAKMQAGEIFGEAFPFTEALKLPVSVVAAEKAEILFIDCRRIVSTCSSACVFHTQLIQNMIKILANKNIMLTQKVEHIVKRSTREKLLSYLSSQAIKAADNSFDIPFNRQELADYLSVDRSAMSNELCKLRDEGILEFSRNHFKLTQ